MGDILFLAHRVPFPPDRGDKIRAFHILKHLAERAPVHLVAFADDLRDLTIQGYDTMTASRALVWRGKSRLRAAAEAITTRRPVSVAAFADGEIARAVTRVLETRDIDTIYVFSSQMAQYLPADTRARIVMDFCDVDSAKFADYARSASGPRAWMLGREARMLRAHDFEVARRADASLFVSRAEAQLFRDLGGEGRIATVENGIDTRYFDPAAAFAPVASESPLIVFTGQMDYQPNVEGVTWFADAILPRIQLRHADAAFAIVGRSPTAEVRALESRAGITVTGQVADVRGWLAAASVVVAPLRIARGVQNKVLEAMAMARPVVVSDVAGQGIDHGATLVTAADAQGFADAVSALLDDPQAAAQRGAAARAQVQQRYGWEACLAPLDSMVGFPAAVGRNAA